MRALVVVLPFTVGCLSFPREDRIEDTRVLAIATEPAEILYSPLHLFPAAERPPVPLPTIDVVVDVYAFDPRGGRVDATLQLCPENARFGNTGDPTCSRVDPQDFVDREPPEARADAAAVYLPRALSDDELDGPAGRAVLRETYAFTPAVIDSIIPDDDDGDPRPSIFPLLPRFAADVVNPTQPAVNGERAMKRLPLNLDLADATLPPDVRDTIASGLGLSLCDTPIPGFDEEWVEEEADCYFPRGANENPDLVGFDLTTDGELLRDEVRTGEQALVGRESIIRVQRGERVTIEPVFREGAVERYQIVSFDIEESRVVLMNRVEDTAISWYATAGDVSSNLTAIELGHEIGAHWDLPESPEGARDTLVAVVQDQRGGTTFASITVEYAD